MSNSIKTPPILTDETNYQDWKADLAIWKLFTDLEKKKQGPALYLSLNEKGRECVRELKAIEIGAEGGFELIITKLDRVFEVNINLRTFAAFKSFYEFRRPADMGMTEFIIKYESLYHKLGTYDVKLPVGVQSFFVLTAANISDDNERLARVSCPELTYASMRDTLLKIFSDPASTAQDEKVPAVKAEPVYKVTHRGAYRGGATGRGRGWGRQYNQTGLNPTDREGKIMECFKCGSKKHLARQCDKSENADNGTLRRGKNNEKVYVTLLTEPRNERKMSKLLSDSLGMAVLDTGCSKTVAGEDWVQAYEETLSRDKKLMIENVPSQTSFVFGDGNEVKSTRIVKIPVKIGSQLLKISTDVVPNSIPLLLSRESMR